MDLSAGGLRRIRHAAEADDNGLCIAAGLGNHVTGARVTIARLPHRAHINHRLRGRQGPSPLIIPNRDHGRLEIGGDGEHAGNVGVALETVATDKFEDVRHLERIVDVLGEYILVERPPSRSMDKQQGAFGMGAGQFTKKIHQLAVGVPRHGVVVFELRPRPADRPLRANIEAIRVEQRSLVVVAEDHQAAAVADERDALAGIRTVADDVAQTTHRIDLLPIDVRENRLEGLEVAMDVADNGPLHDCRIQMVPPSAAGG